VILVLADDMRLDELWVMDRLNQLARRGTTFQSFFVTTPVCCPSRSTLLTGLYAHHHGVRGISRWHRTDAGID
jgi:arylsulfatase A-like enzyme